MTLVPTRPSMRYHGGKWQLAPWIVEHLPQHSAYTEAFCGAASVLAHKGRSRVEVLNDLDGDVCNVLRVLRDPETRTRLAEAVLSGYRCPLYDELFADWQRVDRPVTVFRGTLRIESLWLNPRAAGAFPLLLF